MASNLKVDIVRPTATNGSLSLKGDSGGSATTNGVTINSAGNTAITGTTTVSSLVATTADINGGTIDGAGITGGTIDNTTIGETTKAVGSFTQVNADNLRLDGNNIISTNTNGNINITTNGTGNVGIGTTNPEAFLDVRTTGETEQLVGEFSSTGDGSDRQRFSIFIDPSTQTTELYSGSGGGSDNNTNLAFSIRDGTNGRTERMRIDTSGNVRADKFTDLAGTGAPNFPSGLTGNIKSNSITDSAGTGAPDFPNGLTLASNATGGNITGVTLDDYEEGTWTPTGNNITFSEVKGHYTKVGDMVFFFCKFVFPNTSDSSAAVISGLPFNPSTSDNTNSSVTIGYENSSSTDLTSLVNSSSNYFDLRVSGTTKLNSDFSLGTFYVSGFYKA